MVSVSLEVLVYGDGRVLVGLDQGGAVDDDVDVRDRENSGFA